MEATILCLDNSEWMRNGDFFPSRLLAQSDAAILLGTRKIDQNPESAVAVVSMAGKGPKVLVTLSNDDGKIMNAISSVKIEGKSDIMGTLQLAQLALKHKLSKSQKQRIVLFIGSPLTDSREELVRMGKRLKKNNIAVDVISFGETLENSEKLQPFHDAVNNNDNSSLLSVPSGPHNLSDYLCSFPDVLNGGAGGDSAGSSGGGLVGSVDPNLDPELAAALRMSLEDYESQQQEDIEEVVPEAVEEMDIDEDDMLQEALRMSMQASAPVAEAAEAPVPEAMDFEESDDDAGLYDDLDEEAQLAMAMEMSMGKAEEPAPDSKESLVQDALNDPSFVDSIFDNIEGIDPNDPLIQSALRGLNDQDKQDKKSE